MNRISLLAAVSGLVLAAQGSGAAERYAIGHFGIVELGKAPKSAKILYNQNSNGDGNSVSSENFTSGTNTDAAADDFVVPQKTKWTVTEVDVTGLYFNGYGPSTQNVIFYEDNHGLPGKAVKKGSFVSLNGSDNAGSFAIKLPGHGLSLKQGMYWVSVVANCSFQAGCGQWNWATTATVRGNQAVWEDAGSNTCPTWGTLEACLGLSGDLMFDLRGSAKHD